MHAGNYLDYTVFPHYDLRNVSVAYLQFCRSLTCMVKFLPPVTGTTRKFLLSC